MTDPFPNDPLKIDLWVNPTQLARLELIRRDLVDKGDFSASVSLRDFASVFFNVALNREFIKLCIERKEKENEN